MCFQCPAAASRWLTQAEASKVYSVCQVSSLPSYLLRCCSPVVGSDKLQHSSDQGCHVELSVGLFSVNTLLADAEGIKVCLPCCMLSRPLSLLAEAAT